MSNEKCECGGDMFEHFDFHGSCLKLHGECTCEMFLPESLAKYNIKEDEQ